LGVGFHNLRTTVVLALVFASVQFAITLWGYGLPRPRDWVPLLVMALTVGVFESIFFRGFVQERLEESLGVGPAILGASILYALYHVGYGMRADEMLFLFGLGVVYAIAYRLTQNVFVLWPLLTPLGSFFAQLEAGELAGELPWASIAGFVDVLGLMAFVIWLAHRLERRRQREVLQHDRQREVGRDGRESPPKRLVRPMGGNTDQPTSRADGSHRPDRGRSYRLRRGTHDRSVGDRDRRP
jgi:hypothetical protein